MIMRSAIVLSVLALAGNNIGNASAEVLRRSCVTVSYGTRTCTEIRRVVKTDRIMGMTARKNIRGLRQGRCMPSPSGACGGE
jgi:hypothetical protein